MLDSKRKNKVLKQALARMQDEIGFKDQVLKSIQVTEQDEPDLLALK